MFDRALETSVDILAPADVAWAVLAETSAWPEWNPILVECEGRLEPGQRLSLTAHMPGRSAWSFKPTVLTGEGEGWDWGWACLSWNVGAAGGNSAGTSSPCRCTVLPSLPNMASVHLGAFHQAAPSSPALPPTRNAADPPAVEPNAKLEWRGSLAVPGLFAGRHYFVLEPAGSGACRLVHGEEFSGLLLPLMGGLLADTEKGFHAMNAALKARAEARAGLE